MPYSPPNLVDIDNDGDLDLFVGNSLSKISYYENAGDKNTAQWNFITNDYQNL
ncbi:hypothetical protein [Candidatus Venteria ishoeyi]|uniref:FG-GAP repeat protein n=1 Tax=Candidatus Venteria ishoeyi TaxID=1899563 RepID=A0A1H6F8R3_9GAMM|nr:hypothetical protein [Candidatus Venteria ishoeyi]SEH05476.1 Uncharacterised protein [Candidatus Venteria ishoeyi]